MKQLVVTPILGLPQFSGWGHVITAPDSSYCVSLAVKGDNARNVGRDLADAFKERPPSDGESFYAALTSAVEFVQQKNCQLCAVGVYFTGERVLLAAIRGKIILKRADKVGTLVQGDDNLKIIQGSIDQEDSLAFLTEQAYTFEGEITQKLRQGFDIDTIVTSLVPGVHAAEDSSAVVIAFLGYQEVVEEDSFSGFEDVSFDAPIKTSTSQESPSATTNSNPVDEISFEPSIFDDVASEDVEAELPDQSDLTSFAPSSSHDESTSPQTAPTIASTLAASKDTKPSSNPSSTRPAISDQIGKVASTGKSLIGRVFGIGRKAAQSVFGVVTQSGVYVRQDSRRQVARLVVPLLVLVLAGVAAAGIWHSGRQQQITAAQEVMEPVIRQFEEAQSLAEQDPIVARKSVEEVLDRLRVLEEGFAAKPLSAGEVAGQITQVQEYYDSISGKEEFEDLPVFADLRAVIDNFIVTATDFNQGNLLFVDQTQRGVIVLSVADGSTQNFTFEETGDITDASLDGDTIYLLAGNGLYRFNLGDEAPTQLRSDDDQLVEASLIENFGSTLYVVNSANRELYRYGQADGSYQSPSSWLRSSPGLDFETITHFEIDGDVWISTNQGQLFKYRTGTDEAFEITDLTEPLTDAVYVFTGPEMDNLYLLENTKNRLVVIRKSDGVFVKEIKSASLASSVVVAVDEENNQAYAVSGGEVYQVGL